MAYKIVSRILGLFLLVTAGLKFYGLALDPAGRTGVFAGPEWQVAIFEMEVLLALWLLSGSKPVGAWIASLLAFSGFAMASFYMGFVGQASCGCFGAVKVNPWYTFSLDIVILAVLALRRPDLTDIRRQPRTEIMAALRPMAGGVVGISLCLGLLSGIAYIVFGSTGAAIAHLRGERISISPRVLDMGVGSPGDVREATVEVTNWTDQPVRLIGGTSDSSCVVTDDLPLTIPPGESCTLTVKMSLSEGRGMFNRKALLMTDCDQARKLAFRLTGQINRNTTSVQAKSGN